MDVRCGMDLDSIEPLEWANLEAATDDFIERSQSQLDACAALLSSGHPHGTPLVKQETHMSRIGECRFIWSHLLDHIRNCSHERPGGVNNVIGVPCHPVGRVRVVFCGI